MISINHCIINLLYFTLIIYYLVKITKIIKQILLTYLFQLLFISIIIKYNFILSIKWY